MTRVLLVASRVDTRGPLADALVGDGCEVIASVATLEAASAEARDQADVIVLAAGDLQVDAAIDEIVASLPEVAVVVVSASPAPARQLRRHRAGWAVVPENTPLRGLAATVRTAVAGLVTIPGGWLGRAVDGEPLPFDLETPADVGTHDEPLTPREREVLTLLADGLSNRGMAARLGISEHTVKFHVSAIYAKLGVANRAEAVARGWQRGLVAL